LCCLIELGRLPSCSAVCTSLFLSHSLTLSIQQDESRAVRDLRLHAHDGARPRDSDLRRCQVQLSRLHQRQIGGHDEPPEPPPRVRLRGPRLPRHRGPLFPQRRVGGLRRRLRHRQDLGHAKRLRFEEGVQSPLRSHRRPSVVSRWSQNRCLRRRQREVLRPRFYVSSPNSSILFFDFL